MYTAVKLLASLLKTTRVEEGIILPLVRLVAEAFTVSSLKLIQVAASGILLSISYLFLLCRCNDE